MSYKLEFKKLALKEWKKLDPTVQTQFKKKLQERNGVYIKAIDRLP